MKLTKKSDIRSLTLLMTLVYFASYLTRLNFSTVMAEFVAAENVLKSSASVIITANFITYGVGQLISGVLGDKVSPRYLVFIGFCATITCNLLMPLVAPSIPIMTVIWAFNGLAQAFMWPPIVKILSAALRDIDYGSSVSKICFGSAGGTLAMYVISPVTIALSSWKVVFIISAVCGIVMAGVWMVWSKKLLNGIDVLQKAPKAQKTKDLPKNNSPLLRTMLFILPVILITISLQGMLRDGISTWVPSFISESFGLGEELSILITVILPIFHVFCTLFTFEVYKRLKENAFVSILVFFSAVTLALICLRLFGTLNIVTSIIMLAFVNGFIHCVNSLQTCYLPLYFKDSGKMSTYSGVLNFATYIGSAASTYLFAMIAENSSWNTTILCWVFIGIAATLITLGCYMPVKKHIKNRDVQ